MFLSRALLLCLGALPLLTAPAAALTATPSTGRAHRYERIEWRLTGVPAAANPFQPELITVDLELTTPSGRELSVPGFAHRAVEAVVQPNPPGQPPKAYSPVYHPKGEWLWAVRYCPAETGRHVGRVVVRLAGRVKAATRVVFTVADSASPGFIRLAPGNPAAFAHDDGTPYFAIGENLCYASLVTHDSDRLGAYRAWLDRLHANGANHVRLWLGAEQGFGLEGSRPYDYNQSTGHLIDEIQRLCEARGIAIKFCFEYVRTFVPGRLYYRADYPYMTANGGTCDTIAEMLAQPAAQRQWQALQRYIVARWGASTSTFTWELWNEMDEIDASDAAIAAWSQLMAAHLKRIDPYGHLVSNSLGSTGDLPALWNQPAIDYVNYHDYGGERQVDRTQFDLYWEPLTRAAAAYGKAVFLNEAGLVDKQWLAYGPATHPRFKPEGPKDTRGYAFHETLWAGVFGTGCGTGMTWWWDSTVHAFDLYPQFKAVRTFVDGVPLHAAPTTPSRPATDRAHLAAFARTGPWGSIAWVINRQDSWRPLVLEGKSPERVTGARVTLPLPAAGTYAVRFVDAWTGADIASTTIEAADDRAELALPDFTVDVLVRAERR